MSFYKNLKDKEGEMKGNMSFLPGLSFGYSDQTISKKQITTPRKRQALIHALLTSAVLILVINYFLRDSLYSLGLDIIISMQTEHSQLGRYFFEFMTIASEPVVVMIVILGILLGENKRKHAFNVTMYLLLNIYLITLLKEFYADPRPYWSVDAIDSSAIYCPAQFGNPSGHSWFITVFIFVMVFKYLPLSKVKGLVTAAIVIALVATSRMYLGAHSLNQVTLGVVLGLIMNCLYFICGLDQQITEFLERFNIEPMLGWKKYMLLFHGLSFLAYFYAQNHISRHADTYSHYTKSAIDQCGKAKPASEINFSLLLASGLVINFCTGFALGYEGMSLSQRGRKYLQGAWEINEQRFPDWFGKMLYYLIQFISLLSGLALAAVIVWLTVLDKWMVFFILWGGAMLSGYIFTRKACELLYKFSIICEIL